MVDLVISYMLLELFYACFMGLTEGLNQSVGTASGQWAGQKQAVAIISHVDHIDTK